MKLRILAFVAACGIGAAPAQYGPPGEGGYLDERIYTALWWNPAESGWGLNTTHQGNILFGTLFTYAADGQPLWLVAPNLAGMASYDPYEMAMGTLTYTGPLYRTNGPAFNASPWTPIDFRQVGAMTIEFSSVSTGTLSYSVDGVMVTKAVQRQVFATPVPLCTAATGSRAGLANYQDLWWNPAESGWGINLVHQGSILFATLFTYAANGRDLWVVAPNLQAQPDGSFTGPLYSTTGPVFNTNPWVPIGFAQVGDMRLAFADGEHGTLTYNIGTASVTKPITRQVFAATTSACR